MWSNGTIIQLYQICPIVIIDKCGWKFHHSHLSISEAPLNSFKGRKQPVNYWPAAFLVASLSFKNKIYICINFDIHMYIHKLTNNRTLKQSISGNRLL